MKTRDEGEVFGEMGWRVKFRKLDGRNAVLIERPEELCRRSAFLRARLSRLRLWNSDLNEPAPEVRAVMIARELLKVSGCTEEELSEFLQGTRVGVRELLVRSLVRTKGCTREKLEGLEQELSGASEFLSYFAWKSAFALEPDRLKRMARAVEAVKRIETEEEQLQAAERLGDCFIGLCSKLKRLPTKKELRDEFDPEMDPARFSVLLKDALLGWLPDDHKAKGSRRR